MIVMGLNRDPHGQRHHGDHHHVDPSSSPDGSGVMTQLIHGDHHCDLLSSPWRLPTITVIISRQSRGDHDSEPRYGQICVVLGLHVPASQHSPCAHDAPPSQLTPHCVPLQRIFRAHVFCARHSTSVVFLAAFVIAPAHAFRPEHVTEQDCPPQAMSCLQVPLPTH
jgi:hypothetical protein